MDIIRLRAGETASPDVDCIRLHLLTDGRVRLEGSLLEGEESVSLTRSFYASVQEAEAAGQSWAADHGVASLHISVLGPAELDAE